jgi:hypothetical protein
MEELPKLQLAKPIGAKRLHVTVCKQLPLFLFIFHLLPPSFLSRDFVLQVWWRRTRNAEEAQHTTERDTDLPQVQGLRGEVKPLRHVFLYCTAIPRKVYKVLVTKLKLDEG